MENDRTDAAHLFMFIEVIKNTVNGVIILIYGWHLVGIWLRVEVGRTVKHVSSQNGLPCGGTQLHLIKT